MKNLILSLCLLFLSLPAIAVDHTVHRDWLQIAAAGESVMITAEDGDIVIVWSAGKPAKKRKKGLRLKNGDSLVLSPSAGDVWAKASSITDSPNGVKVTSNKSDEANLP